MVNRIFFQLLRFSASPKLIVSFILKNAPNVSKTLGHEETQLWVDKYKPSASKGIIGQQGRYLALGVYGRPLGLFMNEQEPKL